MHARGLPAGRRAGLRAWRVDDEQAGDAQVELAAFAQRLRARADVGAGHVGRADLLRDATRLAVLHVRPPHVVQDLRLACRIRAKCEGV